MANVIGKDKLPLDGREEYSNSIMDDIHLCAKDPYNNMKWIEGDNPFQTLSTMIEVSEAVLVRKKLNKINKNLIILVE